MAGRSKAEPGAPARVRATIDTQRKAVELRAAGATYREIGRQLKIDHTWARELVIRALDHAQYEHAGIMRSIEGERLDKLQRAVWSSAMRGNVGAVRAALRIMERRARLFGLDHSDAIAERVTAVAEQQGQLLAEGVITLLRELGLDTDPAARAAAAAMLESLAPRELEGAILDVEIVEDTTADGEA